MKIPLAEAHTLEGMGILRGGPKSDMPAQAIDLFVLVALAGEAGIARSRIPAEFLAEPVDTILPLELAGWVAWEFDNRGRPCYLTMTWKGQEALKHAGEVTQGCPIHKALARRKRLMTAPQDNFIPQ